jgi:hypothetical protein
MTSINPQCQSDQEIPGPPNPDPDSRFPVESGIGDSLFPGQIGNRGFAPRFPAENRESGDPIPDSRVTSDSEH